MMNKIKCLIEAYNNDDFIDDLIDIAKQTLTAGIHHKIKDRTLWPVYNTLATVRQANLNTLKED